MEHVPGSNPNDIKEEVNQDQDTSTKISASEFIRFIFYSSLFCIVIMTQINIELSYHISYGVTSAVFKLNSWGDLETLNQMKDWLYDDFIPLLFEEDENLRVNNEKTTEFNYLRLNWFNRVITPVRFVQKRMELVNNSAERFEKQRPYVWAEHYIDIYEKDAPGEDKEDFGVGNIYTYQDSIGINRSGGFQVLLDVITLNEAYYFLNFTMYHSKWIDKQTAAITIDFASYNGHYDMVTYTVFTFNIYPTGYLKKSIDVSSFRIEQYRTAGNAIRAICEGLFLLLTILYTAIEIIKIKVDIIATRTDIIEKQGPLSKAQEFSAFLAGIKVHISNFWNILDITSIMLSYIGLILWINFIMNPILLEKEYSRDAEHLNNFLEIKQVYVNYTRISSLNLLLIFFRLMKYMGKFERIHLLHATLMAARKDILYFFILLVGIFMAFVIFGHVGFGSISIQFSTLQGSIASCLLIIFGYLDVVMYLLGIDIVKTVIFFFSFTFLITFILINMFIAILSNAYSDNLISLEERNRKEAKLHIAHLHPIFQMKQGCINAYAKLRSWCSKRLKIAQKYKNENIRLSEAESEPVTLIKDFNLEYVDYIHDRDTIDSNVLTDNERYIRLKESVHLLSKKIWSVLLFLLYLFVSTAVILSQQQIQLKYELSSSITKAIYDSVYNEDQTLSDIKTFEDLFNWLGQAFPSIIKEDRYGQIVLQSNYLLGQQLEPSSDTCLDAGAVRATFRRIKTIDNLSDIFYNVEPKVRAGLFKPTDVYSEIEETGDLDFPSSCSMKYSEEGGLWNRGGYIVYLSSSVEKLTKQFEGLTKLKIFDNSMNCITLDFVLYNPDLNHFTYVAIIFWFVSGGEISRTVSIVPLRTDPYVLDDDKVRAFFEGIYILLLILHIYITVMTVYNRYKNYNNWLSRFNELLTSSQRRKRELAKPEWLRRLSVLLDIYIIIDILSYIFAFICLGIWFNIVGASEQFSLKLPTSDTDYFDYFAYIAYNTVSYQSYSAIYILLLYFRILQFTTISKSLTFLQDILSQAIVNIVYFLLMIFTLLMGYVLMAYLALGTSSESFSTIGEAFMTCFNMLIGNFEYEEIMSADQVLGPIFFFSFMIFFTFVLLNIFIAILEHAYSKVKEATDTMGDKSPGFIESLVSIFLNIKKLFERNAKHKSTNEQVSRDLARFVFLRFETGMEPEEDPEAWGIKFSDQILMERSKRRENYNILQKLFRIRKQKELDGSIFIQIKPEAIEDEKKARFSYWDYLRIGYQEISKHERIIQRSSLKQQEELISRRAELDRKRIEQEEILHRTYVLERRLSKLREESSNLIKMMNKE